jgi:hypothetical protein
LEEQLSRRKAVMDVLKGLGRSGVRWNMFEEKKEKGV